MILLLALGEVSQDFAGRRFIRAEEEKDVRRTEMGEGLGRQMTRRSFTKLAALTSTAVALGGTSQAEPVLAETNAAAEGGTLERIRSGCRACGKMECGVWVTVKDGKVIRIEGDEEGSPQSAGNCCTKSQSSLQAAYHPDRLRYPLKRTKPKGEDPGWVRITWDEVWDITAKNIKSLQEKYGKESIMTMNGTSRVWGSGGASVTTALGTPNKHSAGQICKGPRMFAGSLTDMFGSYWLANTDDIPNRVYVQWGTAVEHSNYDDSCRTIVDVATKAKKQILVDPRITPLGKEADIWLPIRPGTDGAVAMAWTHIVLKNELYDDLFVKRWTNAPFLVCQDIEPTGGYIQEGESGSNIKTRLLKESDLVEGGSWKKYIVYDNINDRFTYFDAETCEWEGEPFASVKPTTGFEICGGWFPDPSTFNPPKDPALFGEFEVTLKDGRAVKVKPVWEYYVERFKDYTPEKAAEISGVNAKDIEDACLAWATRIDPRMSNGGIHYQLATDQCGNATQTIRTLILLNDIVGCLDSPAGGRGPTAGPVQAVPGFMRAKPKPGDPAPPPPNNFEKTYAKRIGGDIFPLTRWYSGWSDAAATWDAALTGKPYPLRGAVAITGNFMNQANATLGWEALKSMDFFFMADLWHVPMAGLADVLVPTAHWLELDFPRLSQGPAGGMGATVKCIEPPGETKCDAEIYLGFTKALGYVWNQRDPKNNPWPTLEQVLDWTVEAFGGRTWKQFNEEFQKNGWWDVKKVEPQRWGTYHRYEIGYLHTPASFGIKPLVDKLPGFWTPTRKVEIWSTVIETYIEDWERFVLPDYDEPHKSPISTPELFEKYPFNLTTGSRAPVFFHSEHRQLPWCRELWPVPRVELNPADAQKLGVEQGDWVWIENDFGKVRQAVDVYYGIAPGVANANHTWWYPELSEPKKGWDLSAINVLVDAHDRDPLCGASTLRAYPVKIYKATPENCPNGKVIPCDEDGTEIIASAKDPRLKAWLPVYEEGRKKA
jgi:sulfite dehydrogenase (quinone) subunit SoeA